jgi:hypothetical protein
MKAYAYIQQLISEFKHLKTEKFTTIVDIFDVLFVYVEFLSCKCKDLAIILVFGVFIVLRIIGLFVVEFYLPNHQKSS